MSYKRIPIGKNPPHEVNAVIECPADCMVKYELEKETREIFVDRILSTSMGFPGNYGFVPNTLSEDGDPIDILVLCSKPIYPGSIIPAIPIGVLVMEDEAGMDEKIIAVPPGEVDAYFKDIKEYTDLPEIVAEKIWHFFKEYKVLEPGKGVDENSMRWGNAREARDLIEEAIDRAGPETSQPLRNPSPERRGP